MFLKCGQKNNNRYTFGITKEQIEQIEQIEIEKEAITVMKSCSSCGGSCEKTSKFCQSCGESV